MANIILSAFADEYADSFEEQLRGLCKLGISHIEIRHVNKKNISVLTKTEVLEAKELLDKYGIKVSAIGSPLGKIKLDEDFEAHFEKFKHVVELAKLFGTKYIRMFSFYIDKEDDPEKYFDQVIANLKRFLEYAKEHDNQIVKTKIAIIGVIRLVSFEISRKYISVLTSPKHIRAAPYALVEI